MSRIGYARVSTIDQDLDTQIAKLKAEGCSIVRSEKMSGASRDGRAELATIIDFLNRATSWSSPASIGWPRLVKFDAWFTDHTWDGREP